MGMPWLLRKQYRCPRCGASYVHDRAHHHDLFLCPLRPLTSAQELQRLLLDGRRYEPAPERGR